MAVIAAARGVTVSPITREDAARVGAFLHEHLNARVAAEHWAQATTVPWAVDAPNAGVMLLDGEDVVGVHLAFYSEREIDGRRERFCNLGAWCVLPEHRFHGLRLLRTLLAQEGYHFTDMSPSGSVVALNARLGFRDLDTTTALTPNLPWPTLPGRTVISADPALIERTVTGDQLRLYRDHAGARAARHLVLIRGDAWCYLVVRKDRRKGLPIFASILHVSDPELLRAMARPLARHLLLHHGAVATLAEDRIVGRRPRRSVRLRSPRPKMFRSPHLGAAQIDDLYSELVCVSW